MFDNISEKVDKLFQYRTCTRFRSLCSRNDSARSRVRERGKQGRRALKCRCLRLFLAALVSPFLPPMADCHSADARRRNLLLARAPNHIVASFQVANHYHTHTALTIPPTSGGGTSTEPHGIANNGTSISCETSLRKLTIQKSIVKLRSGFY